ncbi:hypothetical protein SPAB_02693 [Salmonella enterica subsp. enterica serovar Paratyphi B str. SPB7]|uniref:Uncharacterized protein n=1 Tax=Salmonella paratyphi B (strain ATCC BAA-1250 / SPB7) TaxID=1016998 RepID=A0A6C6Z4L0_SALPB|nr:hypothetical protein SPAB_02693 [Salmonella enterica subsp. enterica serovar Paratyphi B str. SPB7]
MRKICFVTGFKLLSNQLDRQKWQIKLLTSSRITP